MKYTILIIFLGLAVSFKSIAQKTYLTENQIPGEIQTYIQKYFPNSTLYKAKKEVKPLKTEYEIKLTPKVELEIDGKFNIKEIESKTGIPVETLPMKVSEYLNANYPDIAVKKWERKPGGQKVKLLNGRKIYFDSQDNFISTK